MLTWTLVLVGLIGTGLNIRRDRRGFGLWIVSNLGLAGVNASRGEWALATMFAVYLVLAVWGWVAWGRGERSL